MPCPVCKTCYTLTCSCLQIKPSSYNEWLLVDVLHVQSHHVLPAAQVEAALVLVHVQDAVVTGVEGETERTDCLGLQKLCTQTQTDRKAHRQTDRQRQTDRKADRELRSQYKHCTLSNPKQLLCFIMNSGASQLIWAHNGFELKCFDC